MGPKKPLGSNSNSVSYHQQQQQFTYNSKNGVDNSGQSNINELTVIDYLRNHSNENMQNIGGAGIEQ